MEILLILKIDKNFCNNNMDLFVTVIDVNKNRQTLIIKKT